MYWEVIDKNRYDILEKIVQRIILEKYYLAGGTVKEIRIKL